MIRVLLVNEYRLMANIIGSVLAEEPDIVVVGRVTTAEAALSRAAECDVVLLSSRLPDNHALELTRQLSEIYPSLQILVLGVGESEWEILRYVEAGAAGYVLKDDTVEELLRNVRAVNRGEAFVSPSIAGALVARVSELAQVVEETSGLSEAIELTPREQEVLQLVARDLTNQEIADQLVIEVGTVKNHVHSILQKLNVSSRRDAVAYLSIMETGTDSPS